MAVGRLKRESNPPLGEKPGYTPQHESATPDVFINTGEANPLPTKDKELKAEIQLLKTELQAIKTILSSYIG